MVAGFISHYSNVRLHSAIGYIAPVDKLNGRDQEIFKERDRKLEKAHELREKKRLCAYNVQRDQLWCPLFPTDFIFLAINDDCAQVMRFARKKSSFILKSARVMPIST